MNATERDWHGLLDLAGRLRDDLDETLERVHALEREVQALRTRCAQLKSSARSWQRRYDRAVEHRRTSYYDRQVAIAALRYVYGPDWMTWGILVERVKDAGNKRR